ncbi:MAG: Gfo/Idh/MocA family oxidoreductase [Phycisphaeraceae bacterium]
MNHDESRRDFLRAAAVAGLSLGLAGCATTASGPRTAAQSSAAGLAAQSIERPRFAVIGNGDRGSQLIRLLARMDDVDVLALADPWPGVSAAQQKVLTDAGRRSPSLYTSGPFAYRAILDRDDIDAVVIATPWAWHAPQAIEAMQAGKHAFVEVPMAPTVDELWAMVRASEQTQRHCMMLENVNYGRDELLALNMCRQGVFGQLTHAEAAYIHDLRSQMQDMDHGTGSWRTEYHTNFNGNLYPTHGVGPVAQYMNIDRGEDRYETIVSYSSPAAGRAEYARANFPEGHERRRMNYIAGDMNTSLIKTRLGRTVMVQYDTTTPRPYTRLNLIQGTKGVLAGFPTRVAIEGRGNYHEWIEGAALSEVYREFEHPLWTRMGAEAERAGGHGGMDFIMLRRVVECLKAGTPLDQNVYEGATWSAVRPLSAQSVANGGAPAAFPDFSRGAWETTAPLAIVS